MAEERARSCTLRLGSRCIFECLLEEQPQSAIARHHKLWSWRASTRRTHDIAGPAIGTRCLAGHCDDCNWISVLQLP